MVGRFGLDGEEVGHGSEKRQHVPQEDLRGERVILHVFKTSLSSSALSFSSPQMWSYSKTLYMPPH